MIEQSLSDKIKIGGLLCTVLVVLRHSFNLQAFGLANSNGVATFMEQGISKQTEVAVPFFFHGVWILFLQIYILWTG